MDSFKGKTAVITGAASGIGLSLAKRFSRAGMNVVLSDIEKSALERSVELLRSEGADAIGVPTDVMKPDSVQELFTKASRKFGNIHILCNNAGVTSTTTKNGMPIWEIPQEDWSWVMGVNFYGALHGLRSFIPSMLTHGEPCHIVNTASLVSLLSGGGTYGASKHALLSLSESLHADLQQRNANIGVSILFPALVKTNIFEAERNRPLELRINGNLEEDDINFSDLANTLMELAHNPDQIADSVFKAISDNSFYVLPQKEWNPHVRERFENILNRKNPSTTWDMNELATRLKQGESL